MDKENVSRNASDDSEDDSTWAHDQEKHSYYYDDAHGYKVYQPDEDDEDDEDKDDEN